MKQLDNERLVPLVDICQAQGEGWQRAFDELAEECSPLIQRAVSRRRTWSHLEEDVRQAALMGLWEAVKRYSVDHPSGKSFAAVAQYRINYAVENLLADMSGAVSVPRSHGFNQVGKVLAVLEDYGRRYKVADPLAELAPAELDALTGVPDSHGLLAATAASAVMDYGDGEESIGLRPDSAAWGTADGAEDAVVADVDLAERDDFVLTAAEMMDHPGDPERRRELADAVCARWGYGAAESAKLRRAVSNRLRKHRGTAA